MLSAEDQQARILDYSKTELTHCESSVARYDNLSFQIRSWTITLNGALITAAVSTKQDIVFLIALLTTLLFWTVDGRLRSSQQLMARRSNELQQAIIAFLKVGSFPDGYLDKANLGLILEQDAMLPSKSSFDRTVAAMKHNDVVAFYALLALVALACYFAAPRMFNPPTPPAQLLPPAAHSASTPGSPRPAAH